MPDPQIAGMMAPAPLVRRPVSVEVVSVGNELHRYAKLLEVYVQVCWRKLWDEHPQLNTARKASSLQRMRR